LVKIKINKKKFKKTQILYLERCELCHFIQYYFCNSTYHLKNQFSLLHSPDKEVCMSCFCASW